MKLIPLCPTPKNDQDFSIDYDTATNYGTLRGGQHCIYVKQMLRVSYLPYSAIAHAFLRREEVTAKMCCGSYCADQFHLVLVDSDSVEHQFHLETQQDGATLLEVIAQRNPQAKIGYYRNQQS